MTSGVVSRPIGNSSFPFTRTDSRGHFLPQRQSLRRAWRPDRIRLHESENLEGLFQRRRTEEAPRDGIAVDALETVHRHGTASLSKPTITTDRSGISLEKRPHAKERPRPINSSAIVPRIKAIGRQRARREGFEQRLDAGDNLIGVHAGRMPQKIPAGERVTHARSTRGTPRIRRQVRS